VEAYAWASLAAINGETSAVKLRDITAGCLSPKALAQAKARAKERHRGIQKRLDAAGA
jgi:hypothetical protein